MMPDSPISVTHGRNELLEAVANLNGRVFDNDPVITYMLFDMPREERLAYLPKYWATLIKSALLNDAVITEAEGCKAASVTIPPGRYIDNVWSLLSAGFLAVLWRIGYSGLMRLWTEFSGLSDHAKRKGLRGQKRYYYIFSIGTEYEHRGKGLAKAIVRDVQLTAKREHMPIWLEATTPNSRNLYLSLGFEEVEVIVLGKGKVAADASIQPGGPGIPLWAMVWWPEVS
ncbi:hypothetical protein NUU61_009467 [Penicillium alfredii]|uniref:N-acetyltransferase domain-containing protein n=1 Tax=Penicillium alfredii TaxID=1506179 RepID=A0A9W9EN52_9EURO|nr:uncharacterized protein NUU61_009467 [Penicillium alfredii]KAJ5084888.1 hypothetical protein NUU61_009467 [Penicillium alfredii]